jgi:hypothetical protein
MQAFGHSHLDQTLASSLPAPAIVLPGGNQKVRGQNWLS